MTGTRSFSGTQLLIAFVAGSAAGAAIAYLTAPRSGKETREALQAWARDVRDKAGRIPHAVRPGCRAGHAGRQGGVLRVVPWRQLAPTRRMNHRCGEEP